MNSININIGRLNHLLKLYKLSDEDVLSLINKEYKKAFTKSDIFKSEMKIGLLKKIDSIFHKGLNYYIDPKDLRVSKEESIFFRKDKFNAELSLGAKQVVNQFEEEKIALTALSKLSDFKMERILPVYKIGNNPKKVATEVRKLLYPNFDSDRKEFLKSLIAKFAEYNILVFEFIETWNKKERANINGFFLKPNFIVVKRNQKSLKREIFTLIHELGHYLINEEEIDERTNEDSDVYRSLNQVEKWCNDFAYYFLIGDFDSTLVELEQASSKNDFHKELIDNIAQETNLSTIALYTRLLINDKISLASYKREVEEIYKEIERKANEKKLEKEREKLKAEAEGRRLRGAAPKPILSPLYVKTIQSAFYEGIIGEAEFCRSLHIKPKQIVKFLQ